MRLHDLKPRPGAKHRRKRLGCGESSGKGKTCGKGHKGQKARSGASIRPGFEGGQMPLYRRLPRRGFNNFQFATVYAPVNVGALEGAFEAGATVDEQALRDAGLVKGRYDGIKILGEGDLSTKLSITVSKASASAREKIEKAGGTVEETAEADAAKQRAKCEKKTDKKPAKKAPAAKAEAPAPAPAAPEKEEAPVVEDAPAAEVAEESAPEGEETSEDETKA